MPGWIGKICTRFEGAINSQILTNWLINQIHSGSFDNSNNYPGRVYNELCLNKCWMVVFLTNSNWRAPMGMCLKVCKWDIYRRQLNEVATVDWQRCHTFPTTFNFNLSWVLCQIHKYKNTKIRNTNTTADWYQCHIGNFTRVLVCWYWNVSVYTESDMCVLLL